MEDNEKVRIVNRTNAIVGYTIPDMGNLHRHFEKRQQKIITFEELRKLSYISGGMELLKNYLIVREPQALKELNLDVEPEYYYEESQVKELLEKGSLDQLLDCLDFAPDGVLDIIKDLSVNMPLNDVSKRKAILDKLHFNVDKAIEIKQTTKGDDEIEREKAVRRTTPISNKEDGKPARRVIIKQQA